MSGSEQQKGINQSTASTTAGINQKNAMRDKQRDLNAAQHIPDPVEREKKTKEAMPGMRDAQRDSVLSIAGQFLKGDDKKRFDAGAHGLALLRDRLGNDKGLIPSISDLPTYPAGIKYHCEDRGPTVTCSTPGGQSVVLKRGPSVPSKTMQAMY